MTESTCPKCGAEQAKRKASSGNTRFDCGSETGFYGSVVFQAPFCIRNQLAAVTKKLDATQDKLDRQTGRRNNALRKSGERLAENTRLLGLLGEIREQHESATSECRFDCEWNKVDAILDRITPTEGEKDEPESLQQRGEYLGFTPTNEVLMETGLNVVGGATDEASE